MSLHFVNGDLHIRTALWKCLATVNPLAGFGGIGAGNWEHGKLRKGGQDSRDDAEGSDNVGRSEKSRTETLTIKFK